MTREIYRAVEVTACFIHVSCGTGVGISCIVEMVIVEVHSTLFVLLHGGAVLVRGAGQ